MGTGNGGFLLSHGDLLCLGNDTPLRFHSANYVSDECFSDLEKGEIEVSALWFDLFMFRTLTPTFLYSNSKKAFS